MSDQRSFSRCPYCQHRLDKRPQRKTKCPDCGKPIYVRGGDLLREDELEETPAEKRRRRGDEKPAKPKTAKKATAETKRGKRRRKTSGLASDLERKKEEKYRPGDLEAGIQLILGLLGKLLGSGQLMTMLGGLLGGGDTRSALQASGSLDVDELVTQAAGIYDELDDAEQRQLRAVVTWAQNGFDLGDRLESV